MNAQTVNLQVLVILRFLEDNTQFKYNDNCHAESDRNNQLDDLLGSLSKSLPRETGRSLINGTELKCLVHASVHITTQDTHT